MTRILTKSFKREKKYTKLLNNLLAIKGRDQTLFTKVNSVDSFDMTSKFSKIVSHKVIEKTIYNSTRWYWYWCFNWKS